MEGDSLEYLKKRYNSSIRANKLYALKDKLFGEDKSVPRSRRYAGRILYGLDGAAKIIADGIKSDKPFMACRFGSCELSAFVEGLFAEKGDAEKFNEHAKGGVVYVLAGFFPAGDISLLKRYVDESKKYTACADFIGVWYNPMEDYVIERFADKNTQVGVLRSIEPWYNSKIKWTKELKGKRVLVIHPFAETIEKQYQNREKLFENEDILPEFDLLTLKAVQTAAGEKDDRFSNWFEALDYMYAEAMKKDFDVAIIGCGAYGMPLAAKIKAGGRKAVHMGGATQLLFGIKGKRWDTHPVISSLYNEYWTRPAANEVITNPNIVEGGAYW